MGPMRTLPATSRTRLWKRPEIRFQQETVLETVKEGDAPKLDRGELVASFYRSITTPPVTEPVSPEATPMGTPPPDPAPAELCPTCHLPLPSSTKLQRKHNCTTAHLAKVVDSRPAPLNPLPIDRSSYGYKVLYSQGWSDKDRHGLGAKDNKGRREPVKASRVKNDTVGLGIKGKNVSAAIAEKKLIESGKEIREKYEREKRLRKEWMDYMHS
jgi:hypothetical protein